ncbi:ABC transporter substrate-binding protein [Microbacterium sp. SS28]|uniref:ABC transporter substrate-binding protein n=1 Tax=Microbacterium sp. SS28 TaxID=2919948 RepID=UPI001FAACB75|nr:extracellular solute-binding protein [Microbacterium sp. SS28]
MPQHTASRPLRWSLLAAPVAGVLILAGCSAGGDGGDSTGDAGSEGFSIMVAQANDADDFYAQTAKKYTDETGVPIEVIPYPSDAYNTQVTTQLQAGNAADVMILNPGTGQAISVVTLADAGFLAPLGGNTASIIPEGTEALYGSDGKLYGQPTALAPVGMIWNSGGAADVGIDEYPSTYEDLLADCTTARDGGKSFTVLAGSMPPNTGLFTQLISATRVYQETPDWNEQRAAGDVTFADSEGWKETLQTVLDMRDEGCFQDGVEGGTFDNITAGIGGGTSLSAVTPGSAAASIGTATGLDITVQAFPPADGQEPFTLASANYAWSVNAKADDAKQKSIQDFLDWVGSPEESKAFADLSGLVPITGVSSADLLPSYEPIGDLLENGDFTALPLESWPNPAVYDALGTGVQGLLTGQKTVDEVLADMDAAWDS